MKPRGKMFKRLRVAIVAAAVVASGVVVSNFAYAEDVSPNAASDLRLQLGETDPDLLAGLRDELGTVTVSDVVESANRTARSCSAPVSHRAASFCWDSGDSGVQYWMPQGITSTSDADASGTVEGHEALVTSWYDTGSSGINRGVRLSFVDMSNTSTPAYRHILLVEPYRNGSQVDFKAVNAHAGGIVWYGDKLYVTNTYAGVRVFDMDDLMQVATGDSNAIGRQADGGYMAHNYRYILPQAGHYTPSTTGGEPRVRYSQMSLDRTTSPDSLLVSEYDSNGDGTRMVRWDLDESSNLIAEDSDGYAKADWSYTVSIRSMQGAVSVDGVFYLNRSNGSSTKGDVMTWVPGQLADIHTGAVPIGPEDLSYWGQKGQLWGSTEYAGKRYVFASRLSSW
ncbi:MAG TPA: hypothetical protein H9881_06180 [Candidatus Stackebrandtia excrementipullorum]|nr:hypothetical protein [Candidatus Stackebrandtia excrementipullorum]